MQQVQILIFTMEKINGTKLIIIKTNIYDITIENHDIGSELKSLFGQLQICRLKIHMTQCKQKLNCPQRKNKYSVRVSCNKLYAWYHGCARGCCFFDPKQRGENEQEKGSMQIFFSSFPSFFCTSTLNHETQPETGCGRIRSDVQVFHCQGWPRYEKLMGMTSICILYPGALGVFYKPIPKLA